MGRHNIGASRRRRRRDEEGEDDGSIDGELDDDSLSEGSGVTHQDDDDADVEGSDDSDAEVSTANGHHQHHANGRVPDTTQDVGRRPSSSPATRSLAAAVSDTDAMMNGMKITDDTREEPELHFDDLKGRGSSGPAGRTSSATPTEPKKDTAAERKRRDQEKAPKEKDENPAIVPTRGSFFLHDKRSTDASSNGHKSSTKSKSRPYGLIVDGNVRRHSTKPVASEGVWTHDLHETVAGDGDLPKPPQAATSFSNQPPKTVPTAPRSSPPNRAFNSTAVLGNVPVVVFLPGMTKPSSSSPLSVLKKQYTRLPHHRPPLRRDKPVRISLPGQAPRYIFPATERSFIFIPRALRPNQQSYRGRGRGGFYGGGRRSSVYANSTYAASIAPMSRRSSLGKPPSQEGYPSPAGSVLSRSTMATADPGKPVVRLPPPRPFVGGGIPAAPVGPGGVSAAVPAPLPPPHHPMYRESRPAIIPMHQPRPQKAVSVADIETPATFPFHSPQPQQEQPFHHQVPLSTNGSSSYGAPETHPVPTNSSVTPVSHIPDRAIHAQPFQPYGFAPTAPSYYPPTYPPGGIYYPGSGPEFPPYNAAVGPGTSVAPYPPGQVPYVVPGAPNSTEQPSQAGTVAHEAGGTVYFYEAPPMYSTPNSSSYGMTGGPPPQPGGVVGMGGMMTPPGTTYYYPPQGGVYYPSQ